MKNVVIAGYARSPFTLANKGALMRVRPDDLAAQVVAALIERTKVRPQDIEDRHRRLRFSGRRTGFQCRPPDRPSGRTAAIGGRHDREPLLRLVDAVDPHRRRPDSARRGRRVRRRRRREHDARPHDGLQPDAQSAAAGQGGGVHQHGRHGRECRRPVAPEPRGTGGLCRSQSAAGGRGREGRPLQGRNRADRRQGRQRR